MELKTPYFLIDKKELDYNCDLLDRSIEMYWPNTIVGYSFKTNSLPWIINYMKNKGYYAEVVSDDEYELAKYIEFDKDKIIYNGPIKSKETYLEAINNRCIVNIDSKREIEWLRELISDTEYSVGIRVNFDLESMCENQTACGSEGGRFGFCYENGELKKAIDMINQLKNVSIEGLHLHCSSKTRSLDVYKAIAQIACEIKSRYNLNIKYIDIGGGFFGGLKNKPNFINYFKEVSKILEKEFNKEEIILIVEPGMSIVGSPISFVTSVIDTKKTLSNYFIVTDGSRNNIDPLMTKSNYFYNTIKNNKEIRRKLEKQVISGYTCMEHDRLFNLLKEDELMIGDKIIYEKVGAYTMCLSPLFIKYYPDVYLKDGSYMKLVRNRWTEKNYIQNSKLE